jgi:hypothetical protein
VDTRGAGACSARALGRVSRILTAVFAPRPPLGACRPDRVFQYNGSDLRLARSGLDHESHRPRSTRHGLELATTAVSPAERVLDLLAGLLQVTFHLIGPAPGLETPVSGDLAGVPLDPAAQFLSLVPEFVREAHSRHHPRSRHAWGPGRSLLFARVI